MTQSTGADGKSQDDPSRSGAAHSTGESQGDNAPGDGFVKKSQFIAALSSATAKTDEALAEAAKLRRELEEMRASKAPKPPSREELRELVASGNLTQDAADAVYEKHLIEKVKREAVAEVGQNASAQERARMVNAELQGYKELVPEVWESGSEERMKVGRAFDHLVSLGHDSGALATEAAALLATFGPLDVLRASKTARTGPADTHAETGGSKPTADASKSNTLKSLPPERKAYYQAQIDKGRYKGWDDVKAELEFNPKARA